jgi:flagellar basal body-associated protein FliL
MPSGLFALIAVSMLVYMRAKASHRNRLLWVFLLWLFVLTFGIGGGAIATFVYYLKSTYLKAQSSCPTPKRPKHFCFQRESVC